MYSSRCRSKARTARTSVLEFVDISLGRGALKRPEMGHNVLTRGAGGALAWPALLRKIDRLDPGYRA
jgi:hypothetical protein